MNDIKRQKEKEKKGLQALYKSIKNQTENVIEQALDAKSSLDYAYQAIPNDVLFNLIKTFNTNLSSVRKLLNNLGDDLLMPISYSGRTYTDFGKVYTVIAECEKIINILEEEKRPEKIPVKLINNLNSLKEDFNKLNITDLGIMKNIEISIDLFERGETLCSALFASRVISYTIDKFDIDEELITENKM